MALNKNVEIFSGQHTFLCHPAQGKGTAEKVTLARALVIFSQGLENAPPHAPRISRIDKKHVNYNGHTESNIHWIKIKETAKLAGFHFK